MSVTSTSYAETLAYLFRQLPMYQREGAPAFKKDLSNIQALCSHLGNPHESFPAIHIAGTNGKGSTAHLLACLFQTRGFRTGLYTSPHYRDFRERIKIDGEYIPEDAVVEFVAAHQSIIESLQPSFFEITVAMAFDHFAREEVDIAIIETGLGGRLDSTNIITPLLSVITNISFDHQQLLGDTLPAIAQEKAGIIKPGVPVVIGKTQQEVKKVFEEKAQAVGAPIVFADNHYQVEEKKRTETHTVYSIFRNGQLCYGDVPVNVHGPFQADNLVTCFQCIESINDLDHFVMIREYDIRNGLPQLQEMTRYKGRWQVIGKAPTILCDSAHNESGLQWMQKALQEMAYEQLHIVLGMVNDKSFENLLHYFPSNATYYFCKANVPRGLDAQLLQEKAAASQLEGQAYPSVSAAFAAARQSAGKEDMIYVGGSTFVVAEVIE